MAKAKGQYTVDEAADILKINRTTLLVLLSALREKLNPDKPGKIRTRELEQMAMMLKRR